jgi:hypothetical protein
MAEDKKVAEKLVIDDLANSRIMPVERLGLAVRSWSGRNFEMIRLGDD